MTLPIFIATAKVRNKVKTEKRKVKKQKKTFHLLSFFRNFDIVELTWHSEMKRKAGFPFAFPSFFRNFATAWRSYCVSAIKINRIYFVLLSTFRNFAADYVKKTR